MPKSIFVVTFVDPEKDAPMTASRKAIDEAAEKMEDILGEYYGFVDVTPAFRARPGILKGR